MWHEVKAANPSMGVCEVSSAIGRLWRELGPEEKQRHNDDYSLDKVHIYDVCRAIVWMSTSYCHVNCLFVSHASDLLLLNTSCCRCSVVLIH